MKNREYSVAKNSLFNAAGSMVYYFCQWALTMVVLRFSTEENTGILHLAMTIANVFASVANYNMRTFQISDLHNQYSAGDYVGTRLVTCAIALLGNLIYSLCWGYSPRLILCISVYMLYRLNESLADVFHGVDQRHHRMDHVLISFSLRGVLMLAVFTALLLTTRDILLSISAMAAVSLGVVFLYDRRAASAYENIRPTFDRTRILNLLRQCLPAVLSSSSFAAIVTVPRQFLANMASEETLGFYATVATPLIIVQVLANSLIAPALSELSEACDRRSLKDTWRIICRILITVLLSGAAAFVGVRLLGETALVLLYGEKIRPYAGLLYAITCCTVLYVCCDLCMNTLIILRRMISLLVLSVFTLAISILAAQPLIRQFSMNGVSFAVMIAYAFFFVVGIILLLRLTRSWKSTGNHASSRNFNS